jgi:hypothetical protein
VQELLCHVGGHDVGPEVRVQPGAVTLVRHDHGRIWLLADRSHEHYLASWLAYAGAALAQTRS